MPNHLIELITTLHGEVAAHLVGDDPALTERSAALTTARAERLAATRDRLADQLGKDHPRVVELSQRQAALAKVGRDLDDLAQQRGRATPVTRTQWQLHGRVIDSKGRPVPGARLHVVAHDTRKDLADPAITDTDGVFSTFVEIGRVSRDGKLFDVTVVVRSAKGAVLLLTDEPIQPAAGESDHVELMVTRPVDLDASETRERCTATTARGTRCRNLARPGTSVCGVHADD